MIKMRYVYLTLHEVKYDSDPRTIADNTVYYLSMKIPVENDKEIETIVNGIKTWVVEEWWEQ